MIKKRSKIGKIYDISMKIHVLKSFWILEYISFDRFDTCWRNSADSKAITDITGHAESESDLRIALAVPGSENDDDVESMMKMSNLELAVKILFINVNVAVNRGHSVCFVDHNYGITVVDEAHRLSSIDDNARTHVELSHMRHLHHRRKCNIKINTFPGLPRSWKIWPDFPGPRQP